MINLKQRAVKAKFFPPERTDIDKRAGGAYNIFGQYKRSSYAVAERII